MCQVWKYSQCILLQLPVVTSCLSCILSWFAFFSLPSTRLSCRFIQLTPVCFCPFREMKRRKCKEPWHPTRVNSPKHYHMSALEFTFLLSLCLWSQCNILMYLTVKRHSLTHCRRVTTFHTSHRCSVSKSLVRTHLGSGTAYPAAPVRTGAVGVKQRCFGLRLVTGCNSGFSLTLGLQRASPTIIRGPPHIFV